MPQRDYGFRNLIDKLNIKEGARVLVLGEPGVVPEGLEVAGGAARADSGSSTLVADLRARTTDCSIGGNKTGCDVILLGVENVAGLRKIEACRAMLKPNGGLWVIYPKGKKHITESQVMAAGLATGMVDNKVISFSATHTGLRFVIRKADRG